MNLKRCVLIFLLLSCSCSFSQDFVSGKVKDAETKKPVAFCNVSLKGTRKGCITNKDGTFEIAVNHTTDTLVFSMLGYSTRVIATSHFPKDNLILLEASGINLEQLTVHADNNYLYEIIEKCRRKLLRNRAESIARVYYGLESNSDEQPLELLECYYNGYVKGIDVDELCFKNGRTALAETMGNYFVSLHTSKAVCQLNLIEKNNLFPAVPLQFSANTLKKSYKLELVNSANRIFVIRFIPTHDPEKFFAGQIWIDEDSNNLLRIDLSSEKTKIHPFLPLFPKDSIHEVSLSVSNTYKLDEGVIVPERFSFNYSFSYSCVRDTPVVDIPRFVTRKISTGCLMYFYDYDDGFILPYFEYYNNFDDYKKMSFIPYNEDFWNNNNLLLLTENQKNDLGFITKKGQLINFSEGNYGNDFLILPNFISRTPFEYYYSFWSADKRIRLQKNREQNQTYSKEKINQCIRSELYDLKVQILLDVNPSADNLICKSYSVFDASKTFFHLPEEVNTNIFLNIYFDLYEIERQKMESVLKSHQYNAVQVDSVYKETIKKANRISGTYLNEVETGKNEKQLLKWNAYVLENLKIDNMQIFSKPEKSKN